MTIPSLLPDEFAGGYFCRLARMNRLKGLPQIHAFLRSALTTRKDRPQPGRIVDVLSELAGVRSDAIITQHSLLPFSRAVRACASCQPHSELDDRVGHAGLTYPFTAGKQAFNLCPLCVQEDVAFHGLTFWRRSHQIKGVVVCSKHGCGLRTAMKRGWQDLPEDLLNSSTAIDQDIVDDALRNPVIRRYEEICSTLALRSLPFSMESVSGVLRNRALDMYGQKPNGSLRLTPLAIEKAAGPWLSSYFAGLQEKRRTGYADSLDRTIGTSKVPLATPYYALALALLFESSDEAMYCLVHSERDTSVHLASAAGGPTDLSPHQLCMRLGRGKDLAIQAILTGKNIRQAAQVAGVRATDLEAVVLLCATQRLTELTRITH